MRYFLLTVIAALLVGTIISNAIDRGSEVELAIYRAEIQAKLDEEQRDILSRLESKNDPKVSEFVRDWRVAYPTASGERLQELRLIEQKVESDITVASSFTLAVQQKKADELNEAISFPLGGQFKASPGL